jgi:hypothetical protein
MGWHFILRFTCKVLPEFIPFIEKRYFDTLYDKECDIDCYDRPRFLDKPEEEWDDVEKDWNKEIEDEKKFRESEYAVLSKAYKDIIDIWRSLNIGSVHFFEYDLKGDIFTCEINKRVRSHHGDLRKDYNTFLKDILVPMTSEIIFCEFESDDFGDERQQYTDLELREIPFRLRDKIKCLDHVYSEDGSTIVQTVVVYKHSIPKNQLVDLERSYSDLNRNYFGGLG